MHFETAFLPRAISRAFRYWLNVTPFATMPPRPGDYLRVVRELPLSDLPSFPVLAVIFE
jgi:hypothetical protein